MPNIYILFMLYNTLTWDALIIRNVLEIQWYFGQEKGFLSSIYIRGLKISFSYKWEEILLQTSSNLKIWICYTSSGPISILLQLSYLVNVGTLGGSEESMQNPSNLIRVRGVVLHRLSKFPLHVYSCPGLFIRYKHCWEELESFIILYSSANVLGVLWDRLIEYLVPDFIYCEC